MRAPRLWGATLASLGILIAATGSGLAAERTLAGIVLGRSYKTVLSKYGTPVLPPAGGGESPGYGPPGMPGAPGGSGGYGGYGSTDATGGAGQQGNAVKWVYARPNGGALEFWINEDGRVAQIAVSGRTGNANTSKGIKLGSSYSSVLNAYGPAEAYRTSTVAPEVAAVLGLDRSVKKAKDRDRLASFASMYGGTVVNVHMVNDVLYTRKHHAAFTLLNDKVVRITIALAD